MSLALPLSAVELVSLPEGRESRLVCLEVPSPHLKALHRGLAVLTVGRRQGVCVLDGVNRFDPYPFAALARRMGADIGPPLDRVRVSRAFTIHQLREAVDRLLPPLLEEASPPLAVVLGLEHLFLEESLPLWERRHVLDAILRRLGALRGAGLSILATHEPVGVGDGWWLEPMRRAATGVGRLEEREGRPRLAWLE